MKKRILIVDDEADFLRMLKFRLESNGYEVETSADGHAAMQEALKKKPDLMILDVMLPKLDGYKVCGLLKNDARTSDMPIVLFSARAHPKDALLAKEVRADAYVTKVSGSEELLGVVRDLLEEKELREKT